MKLIKSENLLNQASFFDLPNGLLKGMILRYSGTNAAGATSALADCGTVHVTLRGNDRINESVNFLHLMNGQYWGAAEAVSAIGAAFAFTVYVPFCAPWDETAGIWVDKRDPAFQAQVDLRFPAMVAALIAAGTVECYVIEAQGIARYETYWIQNNLSPGAAGVHAYTLPGKGISQIMIESAAALTQVQVDVDGVNKIIGSQGALLAASEIRDKIETFTAAAGTLFTMDLNPLQKIPADGREVEIRITVTGALTLGTHLLYFVSTPDAAIKSAQYYNQRRGAQVAADMATPPAAAV